MREDAPSSVYCCVLSLRCSQSFQKRHAASLCRRVPPPATRIPLKTHYVIRISWRGRAAPHWWRGRRQPDSQRAQRDVGKPWQKRDRDEGRLTPDCTPAVTGRRAAQSPETQIDFFFLFSFFQASEEEDLKYLVTFVDGMGHKAEQSRGGINPNTQ